MNKTLVQQSSYASESTLGIGLKVCETRIRPLQQYHRFNNTAESTVALPIDADN